MAHLLVMAFVVLASCASLSLSTADEGNEYVKAQEVTQELVEIINAARSAQIPQKVEEIGPDESLEEMTVDFIEKAVLKKDCSIQKEKPVRGGRMVLRTDGTQVPTKRDMAKLIGRLVELGLAELEFFKFDPETELSFMDDTVLTFFTNVILPPVKKVGCALAIGCEAGNNLLLCIFDWDEDSPFELQPGVYESLQKRRKAGFKLEDFIEPEST